MGEEGARSLRGPGECDKGLIGRPKCVAFAFPTSSPSAHGRFPGRLSGKFILFVLSQDPSQSRRKRKSTSKKSNSAENGLAVPQSLSCGLRRVDKVPEDPQADGLALLG